MIRIGHTAVDESALEVRFACDLSACQGGCCTMPGAKGAPLRDEELHEIHRWYHVIRDYLPREHIAVIEAEGPYSGTPGEYVTSCIDERACVFAYFDGPIAKCAFERAFIEGRIPWRKPLSCHLFPIRVRVGVPEELHFEYIVECRPALQRGLNQRIFLSDFLEEPLTRAYGADWYAEFQSACCAHRTRREAEIRS